jgi:hypothetical protein
MKLTEDQHLYLREQTVSRRLLAGWTMQRIWAVRAELLELGMIVPDDCGAAIISEAGLLAVNSPQARRILRARQRQQ